MYSSAGDRFDYVGLVEIGCEAESVRFTNATYPINGRVGL